MKATHQFLKEQGKILIKKIKVKGRTGIYLVEIYEDGKMKCDCIAGSMGKECRHKRIIKNKINNNTIQWRKK